MPTGWLPKVRFDGDTLTVGATPVPVNAIVCGLFAALSVIVIVPVRGPAAVGVKVALMVQLAPEFTVLPQLFVWAKSPPAAMLVRLRTPLDTVSVTV